MSAVSLSREGDRSINPPNGEEQSEQNEKQSKRRNRSPTHTIPAEGFESPDLEAMRTRVVRVDCSSKRNLTRHNAV